MKIFSLEENVDTICHVNGCLYLGSYDLEGEAKVGAIRKVKIEDVLKTSTDDLPYLQTIKTTGTFDLKECGLELLAANYGDITIYDSDLKILKQRKTHSFNTQITVKDNLVITADGSGSINVYNNNLDLIYTSKISNDILWIVETHGDFVYCGGEDGVLYILDINTLSLHSSIEIKTGVTSLYFEDNCFLLGSYDEHIYKINYNGKIENKVKIGGGVWKIAKNNDQYVVSCMYEGVKILKNDLVVLETHQQGPLIYSLLVVEKTIFFNSFYDRKLFII